MKKIAITLVSVLTLLGCTSITEPELDPKQPPRAIYTSEELGITFQYPTEFGAPWENRLKQQELLAVKFVNDEEIVTALEISLDPTGEQTLRTCDELLSEGLFDGDLAVTDCQTINQANMVTANNTTSAYFQTNFGVWILSAPSEHLATIAESIENI